MDTGNFRQCRGAFDYTGFDDPNHAIGQNTCRQSFSTKRLNNAHCYTLYYNYTRYYSVESINDSTSVMFCTSHLLSFCCWHVVLKPLSGLCLNRTGEMQLVLLNLRHEILASC